MLTNRIKTYAMSGRMDDPFTFMGLLAAEGAIPGVRGRPAMPAGLTVLEGLGQSVPHPAVGNDLPKAA